MPKPGKNYRAALAKVDLEKQYSPQEGVALAKETAYTKFDASMEVHMRTALDPRQADQQVREIAELKMKDLNANDMEGAMRQIEGTARSMGITVQD